MIRRELKVRLKLVAVMILNNMIIANFFFFFISVLACGLYHGEAPGPRTGPYCQEGQETN